MYDFSRCRVQPYKFDAEASWITSTISAPFLAANGRKSCDTFGLLADAIQHVHRSLYIEIISKSSWETTLLNAPKSRSAPPSWYDVCHVQWQQCFERWEQRKEEEGEFDQVADIVGDLEFTVRPGAFRMDDTFGDALAVEVSQQIDQVEILEKKWAILTHTLTGFGVIDGASVGGRVNGFLSVAESPRRLVVCYHDLANSFQIRMLAGKTIERRPPVSDVCLQTRG